MAQIDRLTGLKADVAIKAPCRVATTANITLSGTQTIDGIAVVADDRVLVKDQSDASENGIYIASTGAWSRSPDWSKDDDIVHGSTVMVARGSTNGNSFFILTTVTPTIGENQSISMLADASLAGLSAEISALGALTTELTTLGALESELATLGALGSEIAALDAISANITTVAGIDSDVTAVAGISANVTTVAGVSANVTTVAGISSETATVAGISSDVSAVAAVDTEVSALAALTTELSAIYGDLAAILDASNQADAAEAAKDLAEQWAEEDEDVEVETGQYSAKHHALKAAASAASLIGALQQIDRVTVSGTYTIPDGAKRLLVRVQGAGGGGGGHANTSSGTYSGASGGASGGYAEKLIDVVADEITSATITIAADADGGVALDDGDDAGTTSWDDGVNTITCTGGEGGHAGNTTSRTDISGQAGGTATGGDLNIDGQSGGDAYIGANDNHCVGGKGADSVMGFGGSQRISNNNSRDGRDGTGFGSGGSGAVTKDSASGGGTGGTGKQGIVEIWVFA